MKENTTRPASSRESISATSRRTRRVLDELHKIIGRKEMDIDFLKVTSKNSIFKNLAAFSLPKQFLEVP